MNELFDFTLMTSYHKRIDGLINRLNRFNFYVELTAGRKEFAGYKDNTFSSDIPGNSFAKSIPDKLDTSLFVRPSQIFIRKNNHN